MTETAIALTNALFESSGLFLGRPVGFDSMFNEYLYTRLFSKAIEKWIADHPYCIVIVNEETDKVEVWADSKHTDPAIIAVIHDGNGNYRVPEPYQVYDFQFIRTLILVHETNQYSVLKQHFEGVAI